MLSHIIALVVAVAPLASLLVQLIEGKESPGVLCHEDDGIDDKVNLLIGVEEWQVDASESRSEERKIRLLPRSKFPSLPHCYFTMLTEELYDPESLHCP